MIQRGAICGRETKWRSSVAVRLAQSCGLAGLLGGLVRIGTSVGSNPAGKISAIVAGMVIGADSIAARLVIRRVRQLDPPVHHRAG